MEFADREAHSLATAWHVLERLVNLPPLGESITLERLAETRSTISELPLAVRQAWGEALIEAASLLDRRSLK